MLLTMDYYYGGYAEGTQNRMVYNTKLRYLTTNTTCYENESMSTVNKKLLEGVTKGVCR